MRNEVVLVLTHKLVPEVSALHARLTEESGQRDVKILFDATECTSPIDDKNVYSFTLSEIKRLGFSMLRKGITPGCAHFPLLKFYSENRTYDHYWVVEYDVRFTGTWNLLFDHFEDADFISSVVRRHTRNYADWRWWGLTHPIKSIPLADRLASFNPIYRISNAALDFLNEELKRGWEGHNEVVLATLLYHNGFSLRDFGGEGEFVQESDVNRFYVSKRNIWRGHFTRSIRYRPARRRTGILTNKIYHPVKESAGVPPDISFLAKLKFLLEEVV